MKPVTFRVWRNEQNKEITVLVKMINRTAAIEAVRAHYPGAKILRIDVV